MLLPGPPGETAIRLLVGPPVPAQPSGARGVASRRRNLDTGCWALDKAQDP